MGCGAVRCGVVLVRSGIGLGWVDPVASPAPPSIQALHTIQCAASRQSLGAHHDAAEPVHLPAQQVELRAAHACAGSTQANTWVSRCFTSAIYICIHINIYIHIIYI
jgi:hypothetical protein